ncbi:MAG: ROK family transcriptional regulator [Eubacteriales bacterium]|nr:ROK family transcriptional regulator [Eubacteriales bacterium]
MTTNGSNQQTIKEKNRALVLRCILIENLTSRAGISRRLGLTKTTLTNIVNELIDDGYITEREKSLDKSAHSPGRKSIELGLSPAAPLACGILIQRNKFQMILSSLDGSIKKRCSYSYKGNISPEDFELILKQMYRELLEDNSARIIGIGIASIGPLNTSSGTLLNPVNFFDRECVFDICSCVRSFSGLPVTLCNDASAGAVAEKLLGKGRGEHNFVYISTYKGAGAGFYLDDKLFSGENGQNGEIGHMSINFEGPLCHCGNRGCLELYANIDTLVEKRMYLKYAFPDHPIFVRDDITILDLLHLVDENDAIAISVVNEYCRYLSFAAANLITQLNIQLVILAGSPDIQNDFFERTLENQINEHSLMSKYQKISVIKSDFGLSSPLYGSACIILNDLFEGRIY